MCCSGRRHTADERYVMLQHTHTSSVSVFKGSVRNRQQNDVKEPQTAALCMKTHTFYVRVLLLHTHTLNLTWFLYRPSWQRSEWTAAQRDDGEGGGWGDAVTVETEGKMSLSLSLSLRKSSSCRQILLSGRKNLHLSSNPLNNWLNKPPCSSSSLPPSFPLSLCPPSDSLAVHCVKIPRGQILFLSLTLTSCWQLDSDLYPSIHQSILPSLRK